MATKNKSSVLPLTGGTVTGIVSLANTPSSNLEASTKKYIDDRFSQPMVAATKSDQIDGASSTLFVSPSTFKYNQSSCFARATFYYSAPNIILVNSYNISQAVRVTTGTYRFTFIDNLLYNATNSCGSGAVVVSPNYGGGRTGPIYVFVSSNSLTASSVDLVFYNDSMQKSNTPTLVDPSSAAPLSMLVVGIPA